MSMRPVRSLMTMLALWFFLYASFALLSPALLDDADSVHAEVAREMIVRGDPVTLYANGIRYLEKAPVLYWSMALSMRVLGVGTAQARLPLALFALALMLLVESFARRAFGSVRAGLYAAVGLMLSFGIFIFTRILIPDAIVCVWLAAAVYCCWLAEHGPQERDGSAPMLLCVGFAAACAMNVLTKGMIGIVFPVGTVLLYLLATRGVRGTLRRIGQLHPMAAACVFLLLAAPWHIAAALANPTEGKPAGLVHTGVWLPFWWRGWAVVPPTAGSVHGWAWFYFMNEHLLRYLNLRVPRDYDTVPLLLFWGLLLVWLMPWSAFLYPALRALQLRPRDAEGRTMLLLGIAALLPLVFFSFSTRQEYYVLPSLPFFAMLIARWLDDEATEAETMAVPQPRVVMGQRIAVVLLVAGSLIAMVCAFVLLRTQQAPQGGDLAHLLQPNPGEYALSFGHFLDLNLAALGMFRVPLAMTATAFFLGTLGAWFARRRYQPHRGNAMLALATLVFLVAAHKGLTTFAPVLSSAQLAAQIAPELRPGNLIVINDEYEAGSTLGFYLQSDNLHILHGHSANLWYGSFFTDAPPIFETDESFRLKWTGPERIFLWTDAAKLPNLPTKAYVIAESGGKEIVSNKNGPY